MAKVKCHLLLRPEHRNATGASQASLAAASLGLTVTSTGMATVSVEVDADRFEALFGAVPKLSEAKPRGASDFGTASGFTAESDEIAVPAPLATWVSSIGVTPPYTRL